MELALHVRNPIAALGLIRMAGCAVPTLSAATATAVGVGASPTSIWTALQQMTPAPYFFPLPEPVSSPVEGTYVKIDPSWPQWWHCRRCADYRPAGVVWKLQFDQSVMRIYYDVTGWRSFASFTVSGDELQVFNDAYCPETMGRYTWGLEPGGLALHVIEDSCLFGLRGSTR